MASATAHQVDTHSGGHVGRALMFLVVLGYYWITLAPFPDLGLASLADPYSGSSNLLNQVVAIALFGALLVFALRHPLRHLVAQPRLLLAALFGWFTITSLMADDPGTALKRVAMAAMVCVGASIFLLLPRDEKHFAKLIGIGLLLLLGLAYWGVLFWPSRSIHQLTDVVEPLLAGLWRGEFGHKNVAAEAMAFTIFGGLFVWARWSKLVGAMLIGFALFFLFKTGGKTSLMMVPAMLVLAFAFERWRGLRLPIAVGGLGLFNLVAVGSAVWPPIQKLVAGLGIDATFTDRVDIWQLAFSAIGRRPLTGYGFQSYWQTETLVYGGGNVETWAVFAANGHNAYLDAAVNAGIPGLVLVVLWLVIRPIGDLARAEGSGNDPALTRLFLRIWLYGIFAASLESSFFVNAGPVWFTILIGVFGLQYQGRGQLVTRPRPALVGEAVHV
ncbi:MAG: O-antigen ligase family protein [Devosia nanyangense]|uniref:O-antigen ligase family protein n=1 Tax=Devosia nanyangense TaxID=1228055 RepID=A0A933L2D7_9HYPH|nr:O-antigen ligase family protein [Devosia nanyangense]